MLHGVYKCFTLFSSFRVKAPYLGNLPLLKDGGMPCRCCNLWMDKKGRTFSLVINARKDAKKKKKAIMASFLDKKGSDQDQD